MRCLIVDDSRSFSCAAHGMLERAGIAVVGVASNSADGLQYYLDLRPDHLTIKKKGWRLR